MPVAYPFELGRVLEEWKNTPFRHHCGVKGCGTDCIHFVLRVLQEVGAVPPGEIILPEYPKDWHLHRKEEWLLPEVKRLLNVEEVALFLPIDGDIFLYKYGHVCSHASIYYDGRLYQSLTRVGVKRLAFADRTWHKRKKHSFRVVMS